MLSQVTYASPSRLTVTGEGMELFLGCALEREVRFEGRVVRHGFNLRLALGALAGLVKEAPAPRLDPLITIHPDHLWIEALSPDKRLYGVLGLEAEVFDSTPGSLWGTSPMEISPALWGALQTLRTGRPLSLRVGVEHPQVASYLKQEETPKASVRALLQLQAALALPGVHLSLRPVELLAVLRFLARNKGRVSPDALRYELMPGRAARVLLEPWEVAVPLEGTLSSTSAREVIRTWNRDALALLEPLLPFARSVEVYLKRSHLPAYYVVRLPGVSFLLGIVGRSGGELDVGASPVDASERERVLAPLAEHLQRSTQALAQAAGLGEEETSRLLTGLACEGRVMWDPLEKAWRHRELGFACEGALRRDPQGLDVGRLRGQVHVLRVHVEEARCLRQHIDPLKGVEVEREMGYPEWHIEGQCAGEHPFIVVDTDERISAGECSCPVFREHRMGQGPCPHMRALFLESAGVRAAGPA